MAYIQETIDREALTTDFDRYFYDLLRSISKDEEWMYIIFTYLKKEEQKQDLLQFIKIGNNNPELILMKAISINMDYKLGIPGLKKMGIIEELEKAMKIRANSSKKQQ